MVRVGLSREMDLSAFYRSYRMDGWGRAAFEPSMMVSLLLYAYARGERSSRGIERKCVEDVAYRVIAAQQKPDHATIARFRARHEDALAEAVQLCAGSVQAGGPREGRGDRDRRNEGPCQRLASLEPRLRAARQGDPQGGCQRSTRPRTSSTGRHAAMSCPSTCGPARGGEPL